MAEPRHMRRDGDGARPRHDVQTIIDDPRVQMAIGTVIFTVFVIVPLVMLAASGGIEHEQRYVPGHYEQVLPRD